MANVDSSVREAYEAVRKAGSSEDWFVLGYEGNKVTTQETGSGGVNELVSRFQDDQAQYGYLKVDIEVDETKRTKFIFFSWVGENCSPLKRGKVSVDKPGVKAVVKDFAIEITASDREDLAEDKVLTKVRNANY